MVRPKTKITFSALVVVIVMLVARGAMAQPAPSNEVIWWVCRETDVLRAQLTTLQKEVVAIRDSLADAREEVSGLKGWIAAAAGVPLASGGGLMAWRKRRKNGLQSKSNPS